MRIDENAFYILFCKDQNKPEENKPDNAGMEKVRAQMAQADQKLLAEMRWFPGCSDNELRILTQQINSQNVLVPVFDGIMRPSVLIKLDVYLAFLETKNPVSETLWKWLLEISSLFQLLDAQDILGSIDRLREKNGEPAVQTLTEIENGINGIRYDIRNALRRHFAGNRGAYKEIPSRVQDLTRANPRYAMHTVLKDALDVGVACAIDHILAILRQADSHTKQISKGANEKAREAALGIDACFQSLRDDWFALNSLLGIGNTINAKNAFCASIRGAVLKLNNEAGDPQLASWLMERVCITYPWLETDFDQLKKDRELLKKLSAERKAALEEEAHAKELKEKYHVIDLTTYDVEIDTPRFYVPGRCMRCLSKTSNRIKYPGGFELPVCMPCQQEKNRIKQNRQQKRKEIHAEEARQVSRVTKTSFVLAVLMGIGITAAVLYWTAHYLFAIAMGLIFACAAYGLMTRKRISTTVLGTDVLDCDMPYRQQSGGNTPLMPRAFYSNGFAFTTANNGKTTFSFSNRAYAELFAEANHKKVVVNAPNLPNPYDPTDKKETILARTSTTFVKGKSVFIILLFVGLFFFGRINTTASNWIKGFHARKTFDVSRYIPTPKPTAVPTPVPTKKPTPVPTRTPVPTKEPFPMYPYNGQILISPDYEGVCPFTISGESERDYYVYLKYQGEPAKTVEARKALKKTLVYPIKSTNDMAFFLKAGNTVKVSVPIGKYKLYYSTGDTFYGTYYLFGENKTHCYESDDLLEFYADGSYYIGHTVTLVAVQGGNFDTDPIREDDFPKR